MTTHTLAGITSAGSSVSKSAVTRSTGMKKKTITVAVLQDDTNTYCAWGVVWARVRQLSELVSEVRYFSSERAAREARGFKGQAWKVTVEAQ